MAGDYAAWSPYNYVLGNPVRLVDPDGRSAEDIIIRGKNALGNYEDMYVIKSDLVNEVIETDYLSPAHSPISNSPLTGRGSGPLVITEVAPGMSFDDVLLKGGEPHAWSVNLSAEASFPHGGQIGVSMVGFMSGPDAGRMYGYIQPNALTGVEASVSVGVSSYYSSVPESEFNRFALKGLEVGVQGGAAVVGVSAFSGFEIETSSKFPFVETKEIYTGYSAGFSMGPDKGMPAVTGSGYLGYGFLLGEIK